MENLTYNLHKIAESNKLLTEVLESKMQLNKTQNENFITKFNSTQKLMQETAISFLSSKGKAQAAQKIANPKSYIEDVVLIVEKALLQLRKETESKFDKKLIQFITI